MVTLKQKQFRLNKSLKRKENYKINLANFDKDNKASFIKHCKKPISANDLHGLGQLLRQSKAELYRKVDVNGWTIIKQVYRVTGLNSKWLRETGRDNKNIKVGSHSFSRKLFINKVVNNFKGKLPFEHFCE